LKGHFFYFRLLIALLIITESCNTPSKLYLQDDKDKIYTGLLKNSDFAVLKQFLTFTTNSKLKDTIIIKYDYNNETCWNILDKCEDDSIMGFISRHRERVQHALATRHNVSVFEFREPGNNLNKIIKWDSSVIIDTSNYLLNLLFKERCTCGSSIIIMPDMRFVFLRSDSHLDALDLTQIQIQDILVKK